MPPKKKKKTHEVKIELEAGNAAVVDLGKMLGPTGINMRALKTEYDEATAHHRGEIVPVLVSVYEDRSFELQYKSPPTSFLIRKALGIDKGSTRPSHESAGVLRREQVQQIAERKMDDLNTLDIEAAMKVVAGAARSMGVAVQD